MEFLEACRADAAAAPEERGASWRWPSRRAVRQLSPRPFSSCTARTARASNRDIKPGNLYAPLGQPDKGKIFDLGVARDVSAR
jgi:hypothetical protein